MDSKREILREFYIYENNRRKYNELIFPAGMRSGKTVTAAMISLTELYKLLMMNNPQEHYELAPNTEISMVNVANSRDQAKDTVFRKVKEIVSNSPYLMSQEPNLTAYEMKFPKNIVCRALGSNLGSAVGRTVKCFTADEIADYDDPEDTYQKLSKSTGNFAKWNENIKVMIGSPSFEGDYLMSSYKRATEEKWPSTLALWKPTWDLNPNMDKATLDVERMKDPIRFDRDFGAMPMSARESLFNLTILKDQVEPRSKILRNLFMGEPVSGSRQGFTPLVDKSMLIIPKDSIEFIIGTDPSVLHDAFGLSVGYISSNQQTKVIGSTIFKSAKNEEINTEDIKSVLKPIFEYLQPRYYIFDAYLHSELQAMASSHGCLPFQHNLNLNDWIFTRNDLYDGTAVCPFSEYLFKEFRQLFVEKNKRVDHPRSGSKDQADSIAQIISFARRKQEEERLNNNGVVTNFVATF